MRVLEFYSGIGGLHRALQDACPEAKVVRAYDWDPSSILVYEHNYGPGIVQREDISHLTPQALDIYLADLWLLSPACQPYTVLNPSAKDFADPRAKSFLHLIQDVLPHMSRPPQHILIENVAGFEMSTTRQILLETLRSANYKIIELLLTPLQFGIPNSRLRYYLLAKLGQPFSHIPDGSPNRLWRHIPGQAIGDWVDNRRENFDTNTRLLNEYLDDGQYDTTAIPDRVLSRWGRLFDIVTPSMRRSCCFTRGYTHLAEGSGSILQMNETLDTNATFRHYDRALQAQMPESSADPIEILHALRLRYFTPEELLRLFCFLPLPSQASTTPHSAPPAHVPFSFPITISLKTRYRLIGNSVNVQVVGKLIRYLTLVADPLS